MAKETPREKEMRRRKKANPAGAFLTRIRESKGYDLDQWAAATDYNKSTVCRFETTGPVPVAFFLAAMAVPPNPGKANLTPAARAALEHAKRSQASRKAAATVRAEREKQKRAAAKAARARAKKPKAKPARRSPAAARVRRLQTSREPPPADVVQAEVAAVEAAGWKPRPL